MERWFYNNFMKIRGAIHNYIWQLTCMRVSEKECCLKTQFGGFGLIHLEESKTSLLSKWIIKGMEHGESYSNSSSRLGWHDSTHKEKKLGVLWTYLQQTTSRFSSSKH